MSSLKYFGVPIVSIGIANPKEASAYEIIVVHEPERNLYKKLVLKDNVIVGMTLVNDIQKAGILFHLMKNRVDVKKIKQQLLNEDFGIATMPRSLRKKVYPGEIL
jgi:nitrite reductase (NADH) large subunit